MAHTYPPLNVAVRTPRLALAGACDDLLERLVPLVRAGIADAEPWPFDDPISFYADSPEREWRWLRGIWAGRARVSPDAWRLGSTSHASSASWTTTSGRSARRCSSSPTDPYRQENHGPAPVTAIPELLRLADRVMDVAQDVRGRAARAAPGPATAAAGTAVEPAAAAAVRADDVLADVVTETSRLFVREPPRATA